MSDKSESYKVITDNRQARYLYEILETFEAGIQLTGTEVKSIRAGKVNLQDGYALLRDGEIWLINAHISPYNASGQYFNHEPRRTRKLLLHRQEIRKLIGKVEQQGLTLVPLKMYLKRGWVKVSIALGKGKKLHDKRESLKRRQDQRDIQRAMKNY
ncbi:SsrA-binding protein [Trichormus variabilis ATCC 29413]|jgi:SsrA-binding protein|uniref:SsrA-binding protein n=2 Tax=Anabaena variabilis TaxID=264691 RepID=SSRP_TRIV2|nr:MULTISPECIES: SsrA-binding protein SmpB [Nostocaceae]Q3MAP3.1 RecName: Full=SsrA-binding protein; AltName: Full=Small protein B [Trichormus variabilis ATCC 29413]ABA21943.1 SsrA-binding protein [Trichormus variabilis ATCC 29413]MBC1215564.1 SsrA-binding protein SmpB [Trichormus variabilis ARAD]MBC1255106.1 SsrA-binding protein SmpB [Trichormus variabilis V5]MBC1303569.1 SsrA-binding protein SmpB [Trichormus variabilis N2B]MBC1313147.1 SsrA-binding protein SmpB [Trichormus variabilis PNB]